MSNAHLVILKRGYIDLILDGKKTIESRFTRTRRPFFGKVAAGDTLFIKQSSGPVLAEGKIVDVRYHENLTPSRIDEIRKRYNKYIVGSDEYWQSKADCRYGMLVRLGDVKRIRPLRIKKRDWRAWVVLSDKEDFGLLSKKGTAKA